MARIILSSIFLTFFISSTFAGVPSYIQVCGRHNPNLNKCVEESVEKLKPILRKGIPELDVPSMEVLEIGDVALADIKDFRALSARTKLRGLSSFKIQHLNVDLDKKKIELDLLFPEVHLDADYNVNARILVAVNEKGPIQLVTRNVQAKILLNYKTVNRRGSQYVYFPIMNMKLVISDYEATFRPGATDNALTQAINTVLVDSRQEIIKSMTPNLEKAISVKVLDIINRICKNFTYDELFPDRT